MWTSSSSSSAASPSDRSTPCQQHKQHKQLRHPDAHHSALCSDGSGEEEQVAAVVMKLKEGHARRPKELDWESVSQQAVLQLGRDILGDGDGTEIDTLVYQQCAAKIELLISASTAMRMIGYYLRSVLAARLKRTHKNKYVRSARMLLGLKSSADITAYPVFHAFVQQHCPSVADGVMDLDAWLQEPIFLADIGWAEWRRYLSKSHHWIIDSAIERFHVSLQPDWTGCSAVGSKSTTIRNWAEEYGRCATFHFPHPTSDITCPLSMAVTMSWSPLTSVCFHKGSCNSNKPLPGTASSGTAGGSSWMLSGSGWERSIICPCLTAISR